MCPFPEGRLLIYNKWKDQIHFQHSLRISSVCLGIRHFAFLRNSLLKRQYIHLLQNSKVQKVWKVTLPPKSLSLLKRFSMLPISGVILCEKKRLHIDTFKRSFFWYTNDSVPAPSSVPVLLFVCFYNNVSCRIVQNCFILFPCLLHHIHLMFDVSYVVSLCWWSFRLFWSFGFIQFSSVQSLSCVQLCYCMDYRMPGLPVCHQLLEFTQTHVHWVGDAIQPSHPLSSPSPPTLNLSQHQGLFQWVNSSHEVAKVLEFQL